MNVVEKYRGWEVDLIREDVKSKTLDFAVCMVNLDYDFNIGTLIRNANAFGAKEVFYLSDRRKWDRRGACGTQNYTQVTYLKDIEELYDLCTQYVFVAVEQCEDSKPLSTFQWDKSSLIIFGSEGHGLSDEILSSVDSKVEIPMMGSVRSLNVGTASGIVFHDYMVKHG